MGTEVIAIALFAATLVGGVLLWELGSHRHRRRRRLAAVLVVAAGAAAPGRGVIPRGQRQQ